MKTLDSWIDGDWLNNEEKRMSETLKEQTEILREILKWIRFVGMKEVKGVLNSVVDTDQKRIVYHYSDGTRGTVEVAKLAGIGSNATIARLWKSWQKLSLGDNIPVKGGERFKRSFDLEDFGIEVSPLREVLEKKGTELETPQPSTSEVKENG